MRTYIDDVPKALGDLLKAHNVHLHAYAKAGKIIAIEVIEYGVPMYMRDTSIFGDAPVPNPAEARNWADDAVNEFNEMWYAAACVYVKDVGGGKSSIRSDVPARIVVFDPPPPPPKLVELVRFGFEK